MFIFIDYTFIVIPQADWDSVYDDVLSSQRQLEVNLVQWTSFEDSYGQLDNWVKQTDSQLSADIPLHNTLEEKKSQLQTYRVRFCIICAHNFLSGLIFLRFLVVLPNKYALISLYRKLIWIAGGFPFNDILSIPLQGHIPVTYHNYSSIQLPLNMYLIFLLISESASGCLVIPACYRLSHG